MSIFVPPRDGQISAFVTIMQGCNNFCAYCVVPYLRGREISRTPADILDEIGRLADAGVMEVTLLGQNVNSYGKTLHDGSNFASLIKKIGEIEGIKRIRFTTSHPRDLSVEMIDCFRTEEKLCAHIHLPVQSGSNHVLALMNRGYTVEDYMQKVDALRRTRPDISITSDMIVGFPGETEKDYQETIDMMEKIRFDSTFSFKYSEREGTAAAKLKDSVPEGEKLRRLAALQDLQNRHTLEKNTQLLGTRQQVMVEGRSKNTANDLTGRTGSWKIVNFAGPLELKGQTVVVGITEAYVHSLRGRIEKTEQ
jgi:tRNA-2-methylthio-N6-dimethylallyladenosine synthase